MPNIYCVRANNGQYADHFIKGGYTAIGWLENIDLSKVKTRQEIHDLYVQHHDDTSPYVIGQQVGQIARFLFDIQPGDYVIVPPANTEYIYWGVVQSSPYQFSDASDGCPFPHRRQVKWHAEAVQRAEFSVPFQNSIRSSLTVYLVDHNNEFFTKIGKMGLVSSPEAAKAAVSYHEAALDRILQLDPTEFEILISHVLSALGFESQHVGKVGDGGVDVEGELNVANMAKIKLFVQVKRYKVGSKINENTLKALRQNIPFGGQGAFITTSDFTGGALKAAVDPGFPRIGTINGRQLVDVLTENWNKIPPEFQEKLGLRLGLIVE